MLGKEIDEAIPYNDYFEYYAPDFKLHLTPVSGGSERKMDRNRHRKTDA